MPLSRSGGSSVDDLEKEYQQALAKYGGQPNVCGVDIGYVYKEQGRRTEERAVRVHYLPETKVAVDTPGAIAMEAAYAEHRAAPAPAAGASGVVQCARRKRADPLRPGVSISHARMVGGTLGLIVYSARHNGWCALSNKHVLVPPDMSPEDDDRVVQPAGSLNEIAHILAYIHDVNGDAATALLDDALDIDHTQCGTSVAIDRVGSVALGDTVTKSGLATGVTEGFVDGIGRYYFSSNPDGMDGFRIACTRGEVCKEDLSGNGDSGAVWWRTEGRTAVGVGLHVAGDASRGNDPYEQPAIACHLDRVLDALEVTIRS